MNRIPERLRDFKELIENDIEYLEECGYECHTWANSSGMPYLSVELKTEHKGTFELEYDDQDVCNIIFLAELPFHKVVITNMNDAIKKQLT